MTKRVRQYAGIGAAVLAYYGIHEGAHLGCAICLGVFRQVRFLGVGLQIDVWAERMTGLKMGLFCLAGPMAALTAGWILAAGAERLAGTGGPLFRAVLCYVTLAMLVLDPLYLSLLCGFFGGGDMNGIALLVPEAAARALSGLVFAGNGLLFLKKVLPAYERGFAGMDEERRGGKER